MRKAILLTIVLFLFPSLTLADFSYDSFKSFLIIRGAKLSRLTWDFTRAASREATSKNYEKYVKECSEIKILRAQLENLRTYVQIRPLISSDKIDKFEDMLLKDIDKTLVNFNRQISMNQTSERSFRHTINRPENEVLRKVLYEVQPNLKEIAQGLDDFKKQGRKSPLAAVPTNTSQTNISMDDTCVDVSSTHWAYSAIQEALPIMQFCTPASEHKFNGGKLVNRYDMARFIVGLMDKWDLKPKGVLDPRHFPDLPESHPDYETVQIVVSVGILQGFPDGKFHGDESVNRYQMSYVLNKLFEKTGIPAPANAREHTFKDVDQTHWAYTAVQNTVNRGILQGFDGKFHGDICVNRYQMAVVIKKVLDQSPTKQAG
jgi:hypothetical protein